jgi:hypothetical protein
MTEVIDRGEPALMLCHWTGIYFNGEEVGLRVFQEAVERMERRYGQLNWMKLDQIARYWAAKELTAFTRTGNQWTLQAPYACPDFTVELSAAPAGAPRVSQGATVKRLQETKRRADLRSGTFHRDDEKLTVCFPLPRGKSAISV